MKYLKIQTHMGSLKLLLNVDFLFNCIVVRECGLYILISYNLLRCPW